MSGRGGDVAVSPELAAVARRFMNAMAAGDVEARVGLFAENPALSYVGTAAREVWDAEILRSGYDAYAQAIPVAETDAVEIQAWECGRVGWALWTGMLRFHQADRDIPFRTTLVFVLERGSWKVVQVHNSTPTENVEHLGSEYGNLDDLMEAARAVARSGWSGVTTIMFTDIANSSALAAAVGDARWAARVGAHFDQAGGLIAANGGQLVKSLGDGTMSAFSSARAALEAAAAIQRALAADDTEPLLQARIGLHTGEVQQTTDDFFGTVVNMAARIAAAAGPGEIRVSETTRLMIGGDAGFAFADPVSVVLRGLDGEHLLSRLEWRDR